MIKFIKFAKIEDIPDELDVAFGWCVAESILRSSVGKEFEDEARNMSPGNACIIVDVPEEYKDETDIFKLVEVSSNTRAHVLLDVRKRKPEDKAQLETAVRLKSPIAVTFKSTILPADFSGSVHKFNDRHSMRQAMKNNYADSDRPLDIIGPGVYYICAVLLEDYHGSLDYDYFINNLKYDKLAAYYLDEAQKICTFRYKNTYYDN